MVDFKKNCCICHKLGCKSEIDGYYLCDKHRLMIIGTMTLGRLIELYQAEQQGKQIMMRTHYNGYYDSHEHTSEIKLTECELKDLVLDEQGDTSITFYIKDEEDKYGHKL